MGLCAVLIVGLIKKANKFIPQMMPLLHISNNTDDLPLPESISIQVGYKPIEEFGGQTLTQHIRQQDGR